MQSAAAGLLIGTWSYAVLALSRAIEGGAPLGGPLLALALAGVYFGVLPWATAHSKLPSLGRTQLTVSGILVVVIVVFALGNLDLLLTYLVFLMLSAGYVWLLERRRSSRSLAIWLSQSALAVLIGIAIVLVGWASVYFE